MTNVVNLTSLKSFGIILPNDNRHQQRYKLITDGVIRISRMPCQRNFIQRIRFSHFFRHWEDHHIHLEHNEIRSDNV